VLLTGCARWPQHGPWGGWSAVRSFYAEVAPGFDTQQALDQTLAKLGIEFEPIQEAAAWCASQVFTAYRHNKGPRQHMIPDFLIAAHAQTQADRLAAIDRGYLRQYFATLPLLQPTL